MPRNVKNVRKYITGLSLYPDLHQNSVGSNLDQEPSSIEVSWKYAPQILCNHAYKPTNQQTYQRTWVKTLPPWRRQMTKMIKNVSKVHLGCYFTHNTSHRCQQQRGKDFPNLNMLCSSVCQRSRLIQLPLSSQVHNIFIGFVTKNS